MKTPCFKPAVFGLVAATALVMSGPAARADVISFSPTGAGGTTYNVGSFGLDTGSALAVGAITSGSGGLVPGTTFQLLYEARLSNLVLPDGSTFTPPGLNGTAGAPAYEITVVASFTEVVNAGSTPGLASFSLAPTQTNSFINMYYHTGQITDTFNGTGYTNGTLIMSAAPTAGFPSAGNFSVALDANGKPAGTAAFDTFNATGSAARTYWDSTTPNSVQGSGSGSIQGTVTSVNTDFFKNTNIVGGLIQFGTSQFAPFNASTTTPSRGFYTNGAVNTSPNVTPNLGSVNGLTGPDFEFAARGNLGVTLAAVPEPGSLALSSVIGAIALVGYGLKSRRRAA